LIFGWLLLFENCSSSSTQDHVQLTVLAGHVVCVRGVEHYYC
jgi:hypothetical protein